MRPSGVKYHKIRQVVDFVTNVDEVDIREDFVTAARGLRLTKDAVIAERDFGTKHRYATYAKVNATHNIYMYDYFSLYIPSEATEYDIVVGFDKGDSAVRTTVTAASNASPIQVTAATHGLSTGDWVIVDGVAGNTAANGLWQVTKVDTNNVTLDGSSGNAAYTSGGTITSNPNTHIFYGDGTSWVELTEKITCVVTAVDDTNRQFTANTLQDIFATTQGNTAVDYFAEWIAVGATANVAMLVKNSTAWSGATATFTLANKPVTVGGVTIGQTITLYRSTGILPSTVLTPDRGFQPRNGAAAHIRWIDNEPQSKLIMLYGNSANPTVARQQIQIRKGKFLSNTFFTLGGSAGSPGWFAKATPSTAANLWGLSTYALQISDATNATPIVVTTAANHQLADGNVIYISGVVGNTATNGKYYAKVTSYSATTFGLYSDSGLTTAVAGNGAYTASTGALEYVWIASSDSRIHCSFDGGDAWVDQTTTTYSALTALQIRDLTQGFATGYKLGASATLLRSTTPYARSGTIWNDISAGSGLFVTDYYAISFISATVGWIAGGDFANGAKVYTTSTGTGAPPTWTAQTLAAGWTAPNIAYGVNFFDANNGAMCGTNGKIAYTTNAGTTWTNATVSGGTAGTFRKITLTSTTGGIAVDTSGNVYIASGSLATWTYQAGKSGTDPLYGAAYAEAGSATIRIVGENGVIYVSTDSGTTWTQEVSGTTNHLRNVAFIKTNYTGSPTYAVYAVGDNGQVQKLSSSTSTTLGSGAVTGWQINKSGLLPDYVEFGTIGVPLTTSSGTQTKVVGEGIKMTVTPFEEADTGNRDNIRIYVTAIYMDTTATQVLQESDPIARVFLKPTATNFFPSATLTMAIDLGVVNKNLYGFRFYQARMDDIDTPLAQWVDNPEEYVLILECKVTTPGWTFDPAAQYSYSNALAEFTLAKSNNAQETAQTNIFDQLNHPPDTNRSYLTSRFAVRANTVTGGVVIVDDGDQTLRVSSYDGDLVHNDENFPDVTFDNSGNRQLMPLMGRGSIQGLAMLRGKVLTFRTSEVEPFDLQSGNKTIVPIDFLGKKSLVTVGSDQSPEGVVWAGIAGIYMYPGDGGPIRLLNRRWVNLFDGTKMLPDGVTPMVATRARQNALAGYDKTYRQLWVQIAQTTSAGNLEYLQFRYYFDARRWIPREISFTAKKAMWFANKKDGSFVIGTSNAILTYPNRATAGTSQPYEDEVTSADLTASIGIPTSFKMNIGSLFSLDPEVTIHDILMKFTGKSTNNSLFTVKLYANGSAVAFDSISYRTNNVALRQPVKDVGQISQLELEVTFPSSGLSTYKQFTLSEIDLGYVVHALAGNS
jgi:photosystem II stability/assembly factor-like uncharacterized protein